jgi:hypothetical protein
LRSVLSSHAIATARTLEQKISDAGPSNLRVEPHVLTNARQQLERTDEIACEIHAGAPWYYLTSTPEAIYRARLAELSPVYSASVDRQFAERLGQTIEIATFRTLVEQANFTFFGGFPDLGDHDDSSLYRKEEPPCCVGGKTTDAGRKLDFILVSPTAGPLGIELKNIREWIYPHRREVMDALLKCCQLDAIPVIVARRIPYVTFSVLNRCGVIVHQTYTQLYPNADYELAALARDKRLLGYHDVRLGNLPDARLRRFLGLHLPKLADTARQRFVQHIGLLHDFASQKIPYPDFVRKLTAERPSYVTL